jgi:hypothetical protein
MIPPVHALVLRQKKPSTNLIPPTLPCSSSRAQLLAETHSTRSTNELAGDIINCAPPRHISCQHQSAPIVPTSRKQPRGRGETSYHPAPATLIATHLTIRFRIIACGATQCSAPGRSQSRCRTDDPDKHEGFRWCQGSGAIRRTDWIGAGMRGGDAVPECEVSELR